MSDRKAIQRPCKAEAKKRDSAIQTLLEARAQIDYALRQLGHEPVTLNGSMGERISQARSALRLSLDEVAQRAGITKSHVWEMEQGRSVNPTIQTVSQLANALGVSFEDLAFQGTKECRPVAMGLDPRDAAHFQRLAARVARLEDALCRIATYIEPHWRGAGADPTEAWLFDEIVERSHEADRADELKEALKQFAALGRWWEGQQLTSPVPDDKAFLVDPLQRIGTVLVHMADFRRAAALTEETK
jgi:transcriptional regulator with XRE-family HTH domain